MNDKDMATLTGTVFTVGAALAAEVTPPTWRLIHDGSPIPYRTIGEEIADNGYRHMRRAAMHAAAGRFDYADGSAIKAARNFAKAIEWKELFE